MCATSSTGKPLNPGANSWRPEGGANMESRLPHQFFPPPPPQPPRFFLLTYGNNFYTLPSYYYPTASADGKYVYVDHQFVPLDPHDQYGHFNFSNYPNPTHNTPISYYYNPLPPYVPKHADAVEGTDGASGGDVVFPDKEGSSLSGKMIRGKEKRKTEDSDFVTIKGISHCGCGDTDRVYGRFGMKKKGFMATVPPRFLQSGRSKGRWYSTTAAANIRKSNRVVALKWKPKICDGKSPDYQDQAECGGGNGGGVEGVQTSVESSAIACIDQNDDPLSTNKTTVMIRNIPNKLRRHSLIQFLDDYCKDHNLEYDFIYLPMDFKRLDNLGYAFVNFTSASCAVRIRELLNSYKWEGYGVNGYGPSKKICQVTWARIQGKDELVRHFQSSAFACHTSEYLPAVLDPPRNGKTSFTIPKAIGKLNPPGPLYPQHPLGRKN